MKNSTAFNRQTAWRIALVSLLLAAIASPIAWYVAREQTEESAVAMALEESRKLLRQSGPVDFSSAAGQTWAQAAVHSIIGGLFDIAEIYDAQGKKLAEALTSDGESMENRLPKHKPPSYTQASYESLRLENGDWALRIFIPLISSGKGEQTFSGYFEGVRRIPDWQHEQMASNALHAALLVSLAALLCGAAIYPVVVHLSQENTRKTREVLDSHISMMEALGRAIAKRDSDTGAHNYRVAWIASCIAEKMGFSGDEMQSLIAGSFLHDVGKIGIPDAILLKPGRLDAEEFDIMRTHVAQGQEIVTGMGWLDGAHAVVSGHHEKWDGSGYPRGLAGERIPLSARIFAVADVFDALCSRRPYKAPMTLEAALAILDQDTGSHFDPSVIRIFRPMATWIHASLAHADEAQARALLEDRIRCYFGD